MDSREKAERLVDHGYLVALLMFPEVFGGVPDVRNIVHVPADVAQEKWRIEDDVIVPMVQAGKRLNYSVTPEYDGTCFVPIALTLQVIDGDDVSVYRLGIWGKGAKRSPG